MKEEVLESIKVFKSQRKVMEVDSRSKTLLQLIKNFLSEDDDISFNRLSSLETNK